MRRLIKGAAIALALAGTALITVGPASASGVYISNDRGDDYGRRHHTTIEVSVGDVAFGDVAYGYRDGYWDNGHHWHHWRNDRDYKSYRGHKGNSYHDWNHDRDRDNGWQRR